MKKIIMTTKMECTHTQVFAALPTCFCISLHKIDENNYIQVDFGEDPDKAEITADICIEEGVKAVTTGAGNPGKYIAKWKAAGVKVMPVVASKAMAKLMERAGADAVVAEGMESGGHIGSITTMCLLPQVADTVKIPVIGAGGIADGRGLAAAFSLGAEAVQMGTAFLVAKENIVHENYRQKVISASDIDSAVTGTTTGHPVRCIKNSMTREYLKLEKEGVSIDELEKLTLGSLRRAVIDGDAQNGTVMAGQIAGLIKEEKTCAEIIEDILKEADEVRSAKLQGAFYE